MDVVLFNDKVTPQVCKMMNYKQTLYNRFIVEVVEKNVIMSALRRGKLDQKAGSAERDGISDSQNRTERPQNQACQGKNGAGA
jgi:hypothetical protein